MVIDVSAIMKGILGINWRTTAGAIVPILTALPLIAKAFSSGTWPDTQDMTIIGTALSLAWTAIFAKDKNVTGGSVSNVDGSSAAATVSVIHGGEVTTPPLVSRP